MRDNISGGALTEVMLLILLSLFSESYGYMIQKDIKNKTCDRVNLGMGTLYGALRNLQNKGWIKESLIETRRTCYVITNSGKQAVFDEYQRMNELINLIEETGGDRYEEI